MVESQMVQVPLGEYLALVRRVEELEEIVRGKPTIARNTETRPTDIYALIEELQNKYARYPSFSQALLADRVRETK